MAVVIQWRRGTAAEWTSANPVLAQGEGGVELDTLRWKIGDGVKTWTVLPYSGAKGDTGPQGPEGPQGPSGPPSVPVLTAITISDVGTAGQIRAGRQLTAADFTSMGLSAPAGLWNLGDLTDVSGNGRALTNKGAVSFAPGINGNAATAAQFSGNTGQALYIADTGAADPFRIKTGSWGCWFRTAKRGISQRMLSKVAAPANAGDILFDLSILAGNTITAQGYTGQLASAVGVSDVADDRWHFAVSTADATTLRVYVDGVLEASVSMAGPIAPTGFGPVNIGALQADGSNASFAPHYGRVDEAFVTPDVLTDDQIRLLYCAKATHTLGTVPRSVSLTVNRYRKGAALTVADFPTQPLRLYNFTGGSIADEGSNGVYLTSGAAYYAGGADGIQGNPGNARGFNGLGGGDMATDDQLPSALATRSYGCWFKTTTAPGSGGLIAWANGGVFAFVTAAGIINAYSGADPMAGPFVMDGQWHQFIVTEDNAAGDGVRRKLYLDGRLVGGSTVMNPITLAGANRFRIGANSDGTGNAFTGQIDAAFVTANALTAGDVARLWAKGSQPLGASPKNAGDHVERMDASAVYAVFDTLETQHVVSLAVSA